MTNNIHTANRFYRRPAMVRAALVATALVLTACHHEEKKYTWANRFPQDDCNPRTPQTKTQLGGCPKLADPRHPTREEKLEFVDYMNNKNAIEGTLLLGDYYPPGCWKWTVNPNTGDVDSGPTGKKDCGQDLEKKLRDYKIP